ncbi:carboxypeptidase regulatory-like domain-containing protein [Streptomyces sp. NBC_00690]|uniref:carboxypeptidase regulatory-like domain-containing protein n=1 Tax=Streptomyces sp. NBC_00690 TaxID=2975808 RepID=UPI002E29FC4F|nr:carboxypeptidase regulatory-like domain-containing protein [Streptomyces sp. NBC_00690]
MARRTQGRHRALGALTAAVVALPLALGASPAQALPDPSAGSAAAPSPLRSKAEDSVRAQLAAKDKATFWVTLAQEANTATARVQRTKTERGRALYTAKRAHANRTQKSLKALLDRAGARYESFWIANMVKVTADAKLAEKIAARPEVAALEADVPLSLPKALPTQGKAKTVIPGNGGSAQGPGQGAAKIPAKVSEEGAARTALRTSTEARPVDWNVDRINAPKVWSEFGLRGEGVVIASIGSGVDVNHPSLKSKYRGLKADGTYDHNYNWFDPQGACTGGVPCNVDGNGSVAMGVAVGDDGADHRIGVAPGAKWVSVNACMGWACSTDTVLQAAQWVIAPTDSNGANPRPDLAPHVVNQVASGAFIGTWFKTVVQAWRDAGIFTSYPNSSVGPRCNTADVPGSFSNAYTTAALDSNNLIDPSSSRGTGENGGIKPNISAPGNHVRSAARNGEYGTWGGSALAAVHTIGTVALMWSAAPELRGNIAETERLLDLSAIDVDDTSCGGTAAKNNVYGEGRLDAYAAVTATSRGTMGSVSGTVTSGTGALADATLRFAGPTEAHTATDATGAYTVPRLLPGSYRVTASKYEYLDATVDLTVAPNGTAVKDFVLPDAPLGQFTGKVTGHGGPEANATVKVQGTPATATTTADGTYALRLPLGTYDVTAAPGHRCATATTARITITAATAKDFALDRRTDNFGTACTVTTGAPFPQGTTRLTFANNHATYSMTTFDLPFPVPFYGQTYRKATVSLGGVLGFGEMTTKSAGVPLPDALRPNGALYPFWDDFWHDAESGVYWTTTGTAPHRQLVVEWRNAPLVLGRPNQRLSFSAVVGEDGSSSFHYKDVSGTGQENASRATIGIENATGTDGLTYSHEEATVHDGMSIHFRTTKTAVVRGTVTDANDGRPVTGAIATSTGTGSGSDTTGADGGYLVQVPVTAGSELTVTAPNYTRANRQPPRNAGEISTENVDLSTGRIAADTTALNVVVPAGQQRSHTLQLANTGSSVAYTVAEKDGKSWLSATPASGQLAAGGQQAVSLTVDTAGVAPGTVLTGTVRVVSLSGRLPVIDIPVSVVVPAYQTAIDAGAFQPLTDQHGDAWTPDRVYTTGSHGYLGTTTRQSTVRPVAGVPASGDGALYQTARQGMHEYRFDALPTGTYRVELGFAELANQAVAGRVFDVMAEGAVVVPDLDLAREPGVRTAHDRAFTVRVTDGQLNLRFVASVGKALVNSIRVTERPDLTG